MNNLKQISTGLILYRDDHNGQLPDWISNLNPKYIPGSNSFKCKSDKTRGTEGAILATDTALTGTQYAETDDTESNNHATRNTAIKACSYLYEFCGAVCSWGWSTYIGDGSVDGAEVDLDGNTASTTWKEVKIYQLRHGDTANGGASYDETAFPIVRCFHHHKETMIRVVTNSSGSSIEMPLTLNVAYGGNIFRAGLQWEYREATGQ